MNYADWLEIPAIQRRKTIRYNWLSFAVDIRVMQARIRNQPISAPAGASDGAASSVVVTPPPEADARELAPAGSRVGGAA